MSDLLYEIGVEEIPASYTEPALGALRSTIMTRLGEERLAHGDVESYATPRRFTVIVRGVAARQPDVEAAVMGPAVSVAFNPAGEPTNAAKGFAKGQGVAVELIQRYPGTRTIAVLGHLSRGQRPIKHAKFVATMG